MNFSNCSPVSLLTKIYVGIYFFRFCFIGSTATKIFRFHRLILMVEYPINRKNFSFSTNSSSVIVCFMKNYLQKFPLTQLRISGNMSLFYLKTYQKILLNASRASIGFLSSLDVQVYFFCEYTQSDSSCLNPSMSSS